jgi:hypothetical protein
VKETGTGYGGSKILTQAMLNEHNLTEHYGIGVLIHASKHGYSLVDLEVRSTSRFSLIPLTAPFPPLSPFRTRSPLAKFVVPNLLFKKD